MAFSLLDAVIKIMVDDKASQKLKSFATGAGKVLGGVAISGVTAAATATAAITKSAVEAYASYEQLTGGIKKLYGEMDYEAVAKNAANAFETVGMSANDYMDSVTAFSASLINSLGGNTAEAAQMADVAMRDIADNANTFGKYSVQELTGVYQALAKGNFQTLDNLNLGFGGTKEGMQQLIDKANELRKANGEMGDLSIESYADMVQAIHEVQTSMNITGTTSNEAATTIEGSTNMMKAAWQNLLVGMADDNANFDLLIDNMVESAGAFAGNVIPRIEKALDGIASLVESFGGVIAELMPELAQTILPALVRSVTSLIKSLSNILPDVIKVIVDLLPDIIDAGVTLITALASAFMDNIDLVIDTAISIIITLADTLIQNLPTLMEKAPIIIGKLVEAIVRQFPQIIESGVKLIGAFIQGIISMLTGVTNASGDIIKTIHDKITGVGKEASTWGRDLMDNFIGGIKAKISSLVSAVSSVASTVRSYIGFSEPEKGPLSNFHTYAPDMMELFSKGIKDNEKLITDQIAKSFDFGNTIVDMNAEGLVSGSAGTVINIYPQTMDEAQIDYLFNRFNVKMGAMLV